MWIGGLPDKYITFDSWSQLETVHYCSVAIPSKVQKIG